ncbi:trans-Golgi network integral membrane protein TGN38-like [Wyeomyia smithii]|uniref:trans-Golgi network integral membrane protein TGN38-like n=1 Tax=Wyeomyia smithii TaxID=174621 RepID=UPI002467BDCF|nr:trans-Golgi network integral membrane protein TGN38-like [Wyeomyia smithii]
MRYPKDELRMFAAVSLLVVNLVMIVQATPIAENQTASEPAKENTESKTSIADRTYFQNKSRFNFFESCEGNVTYLNQLTCELYINLTTTLSEQMKLSISSIENMISEIDKTDTVCGNISDVFEQIDKLDFDIGFIKNEQEQKKRNSFNKLCPVVCVDMVNETTTGVKPICRMLLWGFQQLVLVDTKVPKDTNDKPAKLEQQPENQYDHNNAEANANLSNGNREANASSNKNDTNKSLIRPDISKQKTISAAKPQPSIQSLPIKDKPQIDDALDNIEDEKEKENSDNIGNEAFDTQGDDVDRNEYTEEQNTDDGENSVDEPHPEQQKLLPGPNDSILDDVQQQIIHEDPFFEERDSNFFSYFLLLMFVCILCYVAYHNKTKLFALLLEGRRANSGRGGFSKGRKHTAAYRKLDSNLEEAITSGVATNNRSPSQIIY